MGSHHSLYINCPPKWWWIGQDREGRVGNILWNTPIVTYIDKQGTADLAIPTNLDLCWNVCLGTKDYYPLATSVTLITSLFLNMTPMTDLAAVIMPDHDKHWCTTDACFPTFISQCQLVKFHIWLISKSIKFIQFFGRSELYIQGPNSLRFRGPPYLQLQHFLSLSTSVLNICCHLSIHQSRKNNKWITKNKLMQKQQARQIFPSLNTVTFELTCCMLCFITYYCTAMSYMDFE